MTEIIQIIMKRIHNVVEESADSLSIYEDIIRRLQNKEPNNSITETYMNRVEELWKIEDIPLYKQNQYKLLLMKHNQKAFQNKAPLEPMSYLQSPVKIGNEQALADLLSLFKTLCKVRNLLW